MISTWISVFSRSLKAPQSSSAEVCCLLGLLHVHVGTQLFTSVPLFVRNYRTENCEMLKVQVTGGANGSTGILNTHKNRNPHNQCKYKTCTSCGDSNPNPLRLVIISLGQNHSRSGTNYLPPPPPTQSCKSSPADNKLLGHFQSPFHLQDNTQGTSNGFAGYVALPLQTFWKYHCNDKQQLSIFSIFIQVIHEREVFEIYTKMFYF